MDFAPEGPTLTRPLAGGREVISQIVEDVLSGPEAERAFSPAPLTRELLTLALSEILHTITDVVGPQTEADASSIELWLDQHLMIVTVRFRGARLPDWLLVNWDRGQEPAILAPRTEFGWGWLLVREALDAVSLDWHGSEQILILEKRL